MKNKNLENDLNNDYIEENDVGEISNIEKNVSDIFDDDLLTEGYGVESIEKLIKNTKNHEFRKKILIFLVLVFGFFSFLLYNVNTFFVISLKGNQISETEKQYLDFIKTNILTYFIDDNLTENIDNKSEDYEKRAEYMDNYLSNPSIMFYQKNYEKGTFLKEEFAGYDNILKSISNTKDLLIKYKFLPKELDYIMKDIRILPILSTLNSINIYMINYVYIQIGKFNSDILLHVLRRNNITRDFSQLNILQIANYVKEDIQKLGESGVNFYLKNLKFNYMYSEADSDSFINSYYINEFAKKYDNILSDRISNIESSNGTGIFITNEDKQKFKLHYITLIKDVYERTNQLLENQDINKLPVSVGLLSYDPQTQMLSFNVQISLEDQYNARVSVIKIATDLVSLLRESRLVIGSDISIKDIKVQQVNEIIGGNKILFHNSNLLFKTFVQSDNNVEVSDSNR